MRLFAREYERTCRECGYTWRVSRAAARGGKRAISVAARSGVIRSASSRPGMAGVSNFSNSAVGTAAEAMEAFRTCAKCGVDDFTQRPAPRQ